MNRPLFTPTATTVFRAVLLGLVLLIGGGAFAYHRYYRSSFWSMVDIAPDQPVLFSHRHHAGELRIDCRYCHTSVETSTFAGLPSTQTCLTCHSQLFTDTTMLQPVVQSASRDQPLRWNRVTTVPDHVYFDHSIHVTKGVACTTCHGDVGDMALTHKAERLEMRWCIDCHRDPAPRLAAARAEVFAPPSVADDAQPIGARGAEQILRDRFVHTEHLTNCSTCHR